MSHGFYATTVVLPSEDQQEFVRFSRRLVGGYAPVGVLEEEQVKAIAETRWQLRRANLVDSELFGIYGIYENEQRGVGTAFAQDATQGNSFSKLTRYQAHLLRKAQTAEKELLRLQSCRQSAPVAPGEDPRQQPPESSGGTRSAGPNVNGGPVDAELMVHRVRTWLMRRD